MRAIARALLALALPLPLACATASQGAAPVTIEAALADLDGGGFRFESDVAFARDPYVVCAGITCAELRVRDRRRTILVAPEAFASASRLRASLLDIWGRYQEPRAASGADQARSALRILRDGPRAGVSDRRLLREMHHLYRQLYGGLSEDERGELPSPDELEYP